MVLPNSETQNLNPTYFGFKKSYPGWAGLGRGKTKRRITEVSHEDEEGKGVKIFDLSG